MRIFIAIIYVMFLLHRGIVYIGLAKKIVIAKLF